MPPKKSEASESSFEEEFRKFASEIKNNLKDLDLKVTNIVQKINSKLKKIDDTFTQFCKEVKTDRNNIKSEVSDEVLMLIILRVK